MNRASKLIQIQALALDVAAKREGSVKHSAPVHLLSRHPTATLVIGGLTAGFVTGKILMTPVSGSLQHLGVSALSFGLRNFDLAF